MGTYISITADEKFKKEIESGFDIFKAIDNVLSSYKPSSTVSKLNKNIKVKLDNYTKEALTLSKHYYYKSGGYFDIRTALAKRGIKIDLGGMGKGYGVDKVSEYFTSLGISNVVIAASGDIRCLSSCPIEVNNPFKESALASFTTRFQNQGVSTSGNYNNYEGTPENNHLINPKRQKPQTNFVSITLTGVIKSSDLDAYATAASVMPIEIAYEFLDSLELGYIILHSDGRLRVSENIGKFCENLQVFYTPFTQIKHD